MDFFEHQDVARRKTIQLVAFFVMAVVAIIVCVYLAIVVIFVGLEWKFHATPGGSPWWRPELFLATMAGTLGVVASGTAYKTMSLASGGQVVAENLGGRLINRNTKSRDERVLLNVVDEMAIASGVPSPAVYVLDDEAGINAFAAGFQTDDAVIGVTKGGIRWLSRDELQGVIAHEFSHILNGDMRLNLRLMGLLHGILLIGLTGYWIMRSTRGGGGKGRGGAIILMGLALFIVGYVGVFFAKLIKAAVSRQREYLADASAVQFTRNPGGIAGALKKIGGLAAGSRVEHSQAEQASHMFFGSALKASFFNLFSTHPPLAERIRRIDPSFTGSFPKAVRPRRTRDDIRPLSGLHTGARQAVRRTRQWSDKVPFDASEALKRVGKPVSGGIEPLTHEEFVIPDQLQELVQEPFGARAAIYGLLLDPVEAIREKQLARLDKTADRALQEELQKHQSMIDRLSPETRLPLVELAIPALREMSRPQYAAFRDNLKHLIRSDERIRLFEFLLWRMLLTNLQQHFDEKKRQRHKLRSTRAIVRAGADLLSALARVGHAEEAAATRAFQKSMKTLTGSSPEEQWHDSPRRLDLAAADRSLVRLAGATPKAKKRILNACATCIETDGVASIEETQVLRVIAEALRCPMPPVSCGKRAVDRTIRPQR